MHHLPNAVWMYNAPIYEYPLFIVSNHLFWSLMGKKHINIFLRNVDNCTLTGLKEEKYKIKPLIKLFHIRKIVQELTSS